MYDLDIALENVVPHFHWSGKNCPRLLLDNQKPGAKWKGFIKQVNDIFSSIEPQSDSIAGLFSDSDPHLAEWFNNHGIDT